MKKYRITEKVAVTRVYEIAAENEDAAMDIVYSGKVEPVSVDEAENNEGFFVKELS